MLKVGLTGGLASGKTFVSACFESLGAHVIHADKLGHEVLDRDGEAFDEVVEEFGDGILADDGSIDRKKLAGVVFPAPEKLERLNALVHPHVWRRQQEFFEQVRAENPEAVAVVEAAILIETGSYKRYDRLVVAACPEDEQIRRFIKREGGTEEQARARMARQMPLAEKLPLADYVVDTSGAKEETKERAAHVYAKLEEEARNR